MCFMQYLKTIGQLKRMFWTKQIKVVAVAAAVVVIVVVVAQKEFWMDIPYRNNPWPHFNKIIILIQWIPIIDMSPSLNTKFQYWKGDNILKPLSKLCN